MVAMRLEALTSIKLLRWQSVLMGQGTIYVQKREIEKNKKVNQFISDMLRI